MKLKILAITIIAFFSLAFAVSPRVSAEGEITTTIEETLTTTTQDAIQAAIDAKLAQAQALIMGGVVSIGGASTVGGVVSIFLAKRRKQIEEQIAVAKNANAQAKDAYEKGKTVVESQFLSFQQKTEKFQADMLTKYETAITKANEQTAKATAIIEKYQAREEALAAFVKAEADEAAKLAEAKALEAARIAQTTAADAIDKVSV